MTTQSTQTAATEPQHGAEIIVPLNRLKASDKNARKTPHSPATIEAFAASIKAKGVLQPPVVEIERNGEGAPTGAYLVTIGEGRRLGLRLLAKRKAIKRTYPVRCIVDAENDAHEISLDENVTRADMHPADQFEAFKRLAEERGYGAEEIGARFGVSAHVVRQRLRLGAVAPALMQTYREGGLTLEQLMAFAVSEDHDRQEQVLGMIGPHTPAYAIRRVMTETKVRADDPRARFVGVEAYAEAGGAVLRDLFTEDGGGWLEDASLLDRLVIGKLDGLAEEVREREGWKWAEAYPDFPHGLGLGRVYPEKVERSPEDEAAMTALAEEYDRLISDNDSAEVLPPEVDARLEEIDAALQAFGDDHAYRPDDLARSGVIVTLSHDGVARFERGLVRLEDALPEPEDEAPEQGREDAGDAEATAPATSGVASGAAEADEGLAPLSEKLVLDLTAHRTAGLRDALAADASMALTVVVHAFALQVFYPPYDQPTVLQLRLSLTGLERFAPGVCEGPAGRRIADRSEAWATRLPNEARDLWAVLVDMSGSDLLDLLAHCASLGVNAVRDPHDRRPGAWAQAETLATALGLDMTGTWTATAASYFGRVSKARVMEAVEEGVSKTDADRLAGMKKADMAEAAETLIAGKGWLPPLLRTAPPQVADAGEEAASPNEDAYPFAAE
ncbi:ParB N-terminal domain-containing protein [Brevundimonas sp. BAL450]|jgi:ParB family transcriptional regulator, chromosome partitioning protein|uniref:Plasmid stablization protein ParB n=2 Tax=Brevundimonas TaxID=41275 RepID=A0A8E0KIU1_9CAUL|nr:MULTISPECIES: ParB/RepB/Spo0J family partition protein [Brevundimonas]MBG7616668.1 ParB N-terminal domain-containing protein [Brevundimonas sp. BAL450]GAD58526.1 plasmid stablization protein ParB [Brevundimonas abyssalis TAR-001]